MSTITHITVAKPGRYYVYTGRDDAGRAVSSYESESWSAHADALSMFRCEGHAVTLDTTKINQR